MSPGKDQMSTPDIDPKLEVCPQCNQPIEFPAWKEGKTARTSKCRHWIQFADGIDPTKPSSSYPPPSEETRKAQVESADTEHGLSPEELAAAGSAWFKPCQPEPECHTEYSFFPLEAARKVESVPEDLKDVYVACNKGAGHHCYNNAKVAQLIERIGKAEAALAEKDRQIAEMRFGGFRDEPLPTRPPQITDGGFR